MTPPPLLPAVAVQAPFPFVAWEAVFPAPAISELRALFDDPWPWEDRQGDAYQVRITDATQALGDTSTLVAEVSALLGIPLTAQVELTIQEMREGQRVFLHTDQPWMGLEAARLLVYLSDRWLPEDGGRLTLHSRAETAPSAFFEPRPGSGVAFALGKHTWHAVEPVHGHRQLAIFNFWHPGNTPALSRALGHILGNPDLRALPASLSPHCARAEAIYPEELTWRAALIAVALQHLGASEDEILGGYLDAFDPTEVPGPAVALARWLVTLHEDGFDADLWERTRAGTPSPHPLWEMCFPALAR